MAAYEDTVDWTANGAIGTPSAAFVLTPIEWTANGEYVSVGGWGGVYDTWLYRRPITINNTSGGVLTDYQVLITLTAANHTYAHSEAAGADIRFTQDDGTTALDYWIEGWVEDSTSKIWVEIDSIPTGENVCAYIYCGKSGASDESDISNTFIDGWDFEADTIGNTPLGWTEDGDCTFRTIAGKKAQHDQISGVARGEADASLTNITEDNNRCFEFDILIRSTPANTYHYIILHDEQGYVEEGPFLGFRNTAEISYYAGGWYVLQAYAQDTNYHIKLYNIDLSSNQFDIDINGVNKGTNLAFAAAQSNINYCTLASRDGYTNALIDYDNIKLREYASTEPTNVVGAEAERPVIGFASAWAAQSTLEWTAKGAFATPDVVLGVAIEWDAKGGVVVTSQGAYHSTIEWGAKGAFATPTRNFVALIEWTAKGAFATPTTDLAASIEWDAKGGVVVTTQGAYQSTIEWTAKGGFGTPHVFTYIDLR